MRITIPTVLALVASLSISVASSTHATPLASYSLRTIDTHYGRVVSASGEAIVDARISVTIDGAVEPLAMVRTAKDGSYKINMPRGVERYTVRVMCIGYKPVSVTVSPADGPTMITMQPLALENPAA